MGSGDVDEEAEAVEVGCAKRMEKVGVEDEENCV
jgi:hypothetical protein